MKRRHLRQLFIYGMVGGTAAVTQALAYLALCWLNLSPLLAIFIGTMLGMLVAYNGHTRFTFQKTHRFSHREFIKFLIASGIGFGSNFVWVFILVQVLHYSHTVAVYPQIFFTPGLTFLISKFWAFK